MSARMDHFSRRKFVSGLTLTGAAVALGPRPDPALAEPPPETTRLRLLRTGSICWAPQYIADDLLRDYFFSDVRYVELPKGGVSGVVY